MIYDDEELDDSVEIKLIMPAALIGEHSMVSKVTGEAVFELRDKIPFFTKVEGVSLTVENETKEPVKFLLSRNIDVVSYNTPLRIDYTNWHEGIYDIAERLDNAQKEFDDITESGVSVMIERVSNYKIAVLLPLYHVQHGMLVSKEKGTQLFTVYKSNSDNESQRKSSKNKAQISLDGEALKSFEIPKDAVFLVRDDKVILKNSADFVKIERNLSDADDLVSLINYFIDESESK